MYVHTCCGKKKKLLKKKSIQRRDQLNFTLFSPPPPPPAPFRTPPTQALNNDRSLKGAAFLKASANFIIKGMWSGTIRPNGWQEF